MSEWMRDRFNGSMLSYIWLNIWSIYRRDCSTANRLIFVPKRICWHSIFNVLERSSFEYVFANVRHKLSQRTRKWHETNEHNEKKNIAHSPNGKYKINLNVWTTRRSSTAEADAGPYNGNNIGEPSIHGIVCFCSFRYLYCWQNRAVRPEQRATQIEKKNILTNIPYISKYRCMNGAIQPNFN